MTQVVTESLQPETRGEKNQQVYLHVFRFADLPLR